MFYLLSLGLNHLKDLEHYFLKFDLFKQMEYRIFLACLF